MSMFNFCLSYRWIRWTPPTNPPPALPNCVERLFIKTPGGPIEMLYARPQGSEPAPSRPPPAPVFFVHGGMGSAWVWLEYMEFLSARGVPCYAISLRGHGESYHPSFWRMVYGTTKRMLADDLIAGINWAMEREGDQEVLLVGHSSGGGLGQFILSEQEVRVKGLALIGAVPGFGSMGVYFNWWLLDPFFTIRMIFHGWHPNSPLSHPLLTRRVFFGDQVSSAYVEKFQSHMNAYESFWWPLGMMKPFVDSRRLLSQISGWGRESRILILYGQQDKLMTRPVMRRLAETYRAASRRLADKEAPPAEPDAVRALPGTNGDDDEGQGVWFCVVPGAGHHMQNDTTWEVGGEKLLRFYEQL